MYGNDETEREERNDDVSYIASRMMMNFKKPSINKIILHSATYVGCLLGGEDDLGMLWDATVWRLELDQLRIGSA